MCLEWCVCAGGWGRVEVVFERDAGWVRELIRLAGWVELLDWRALMGVQGGSLEMWGGGRYQLRE